MIIDSLLHNSKLIFTHSSSDVSFPPRSNDDGILKWAWNDIYDSSLDITAELGAPAFIGAVQAKIEGAARVSIFVDGVAVKYTGELTDVDLVGKRITVRIKGDLQELRVSELDVLGCREDDTPLLWPTPRFIEYGEGRVKISPCPEANTDTDEGFVTAFLYDTLFEKFGDVSSVGGVSPVLSISDSPEYVGERCTVEISEKEITVTAGCRLSLMRGVLLICQLMENGTLPVCKIDDRPALPMRGFHIGLPRRDRIEFTKRLFRYVLLPLGYNQVIIEFNAAMRFDRHPKISEMWELAAKKFKAGEWPEIAHSGMGADGTVLEKDEVRDLLGYISSLGFEIIPEVQSLGHVQYITNAYPEIAEREENLLSITDTRTVDERPSEFYPHSYCPSNEESYRIIFDIIDEIIEVVAPKRYVHIGHDEIYPLGMCEKCKKKSTKEIYINHIMTLREYIGKKGLKIMLWSDMLHDNMYYSHETHTARFDLPKDIIPLDFTWYFHTEAEYETELLDVGFDTMIGNLYSSHFPRYKKRMTRKGMVGGQLSTWTALSEEELGNNGKFFDLAYTAQMLWNPEGYDERNRRSYTYVINGILPPMRDAIRGIRGKWAEKAEVKMPEGRTDIIPTALLNAVKGIMWAEGIDIKLDGKCDKLEIEGATLFSAPRIAWKPLVNVGNYTVEYEDGTLELIPVNYAGNVMAYNTLHATPMPHMYYRHQGYLGTWFSDPALCTRTAEGEPISLSSIVWYNPHPEKELKRLTYRAAEGDSCFSLIRSVKCQKISK